MGGINARRVPANASSGLPRFHGATDDVGYLAVENKHYYSDLHATILNQLGLDYKKMELKVFGRTMRLVEEGEGPVKEILI